MIYAFLAQGFEETEAVTVVDILRRAGKDVKTVGIGGKTVTGSHGTTITADISDDEMSLDGELEMVFLPGGMPGTLNLEKSSAVQSALDYCAANDRYIAAICAAPSVLGHKGLLKGRKASCYPGFESHLEGAVTSADAVSADGKIITSRGPATAVALGLKLTEIFTSKEEAAKMGEAIICM